MNPEDPNTWRGLFPGERPTWDELFLSMAAIVALRSTCLSKNPDRQGLGVGAVLVIDNRPIGMGYNGSLPGAPHCSEVGHLLVEGRCQRAVHAEQNALINAGGPVKGATAYITRIPCRSCLTLLLAAGVERIVCGSTYKRAAEAARIAQEHGVVLECPLPPLEG